MTMVKIQIQNEREIQWQRKTLPSNRSWPAVQGVSERLFQRDFCNGAKLRRDDLLIVESHIG